MKKMENVLVLLCGANSESKTDQKQRLYYNLRLMTELKSSL